MTRRSIAGIFSGLLLLGSLAWWWNPQPPESAGIRPAAKPVVQRPAATVAPAPAITVALPTFGTEAFNQLAKERGAAWLASRNRDAVSLLAMWDLTGDEAILREAAKKFPGNPQVCLAMLGVVFEKEGHEADKKKWTDQLMAADPENPLGHYYQARLAQAAGDRAGVITALEMALGRKGRIDFYLRERMVGTKEGLLASGVPLKDAYFLSLAGPMGKVSEGFYATGKLMGFFKTELALMKAPGRETEFQELAGLGLRLAEQQRLTESPSLFTELMAHGQRMRFLKELDPETEIANSGRSIAEELVLATAEKESLSKLVKEVTPAQEFLQNAPLEVQGQYADSMMMDGEVAALRFLLEVMAKANP